MLIEVCHATAASATRIELTLEPGATVRDAVDGSDILARLALDREAVSFAVFGRCASLDTVLDDGDRVEVLRPLSVDPMEARRRRAEKKRGRMPGGR